MVTPRDRQIIAGLLISACAIGLMGSGIRQPVAINMVPVYAGGEVPLTNATGTAVAFAHFRGVLPRIFPTGIVLSVYANASGTATGTCSLVNATDGTIVATATIANGATSTIYESNPIPALGREFDYLIRFRVSSGTGTVSILHATLREP